MRRLKKLEAEPGSHRSFLGKFWFPAPALLSLRDGGLSFLFWVRALVNVSAKCEMRSSRRVDYR